MLEVKGNSTVDAAIREDDFIVIHSQKWCKKGEIVAASIDWDAARKTFSM